jgi:imidazolonepropionase-like amidohydrolase
VGGQPVYISVPLPTLGTPAEATAAVEATLGAGADAIKLMTASVVAAPPSPVMPVAVVRAAVTAAHARHALVYAHPTNRAGVAAARDGGVDILAHTAPEDGPWSADDAQALVRARLSLVPTLSLWRLEIAKPAIATRFEDAAVEQVRVFAAAGGTLLFGTDTGYRPEHDPTAEHALLARAGLSFAARLTMLTTAPAARFGAATTGRLAPGLDADLVVLDGDPTTDSGAFARVRCTLRHGAVLHAAGACGR